MTPPTSRFRRRQLLGAVLAGTVPAWKSTQAQSPSLTPPTVKQIPIPPFPDTHAVWGASGRDDRGHIWFGVSAWKDHHSAHVMEYDPATGRIADRGDVLTALRATRKLQPGEGQIKVHSKFIQAEDGYLYFTSTDEEGEKEDGSAPPKWGSHLWRLRPGKLVNGKPAWEHLLTVPEGLTASFGSGRWIYMLGYWGHVLYRYDTRTGDVRRQEIGSVGGHMSRNVLVDGNGHAYVPRVTQTPAGLAGDLVELGPDLVELRATRLEHYADGQTPEQAHGILGFTYLADRSLVFTTGAGYLYRIVPQSAGQGPSTIEPLGWFNPKGISYAPSLFVTDGVGSVVGVSQPTGGIWEWTVFDLRTRTAQAVPLPHGLGTDRTLLYGTQTRDDKGRFYVVGRRMKNGVRVPVILQLDPG